MSLYSMVVKGSRDAALSAADIHLTTWFCLRSREIGYNETVIVGGPTPAFGSGSLPSDGVSFETLLNRWVNEHTNVDPPFPDGALLLWSYMPTLDLDRVVEG